MVKFMIQFLFLLTYCMGNVSILQNGQCLEMWQQVHENSLKVRDWKTEEFLFAKFTKPVNWNRVSTVRKVEQKHASVTWVTSSKILTSKMYQMTAPKGHATLGRDAVDLLAQPGDERVGLCPRRAGKSFYLLLWSNTKSHPAKAILPTSSSMIHSKFDQQI